MKISVAMATYNGEKYIQKQLDSILNQSHKVNEIILVDDKSTDNTREVIQKYIQQHPEMKFSFYVNEENLGYKKNFKKAMSYCRGEYIFLCDQDDIWMDDKVEKCVAYMNEKNIDLVVTDKQIIDENDNVTCSSVRKHSNKNYDNWNTYDDITKYNIFVTYAVGMSIIMKASFAKSLYHFQNTQVMINGYWRVLLQKEK